MQNATPQQKRGRVQGSLAAGQPRAVADPRYLGPSFEEVKARTDYVEARNAEYYAHDDALRMDASLVTIPEVSA